MANLRSKSESGSDASLVENKRELIAQELGYEPTDFEMLLLAHPGDKAEDKKRAVETMFNEGVDAPLSVLQHIKDKEAQKAVNELAVEFKETMAMPGNQSELAELRKKQAGIRDRLQQIIDKAIDSE